MMMQYVFRNRLQFLGSAGNPVTLFIVNLRYVKKITKAEVVLKDGTSVPLSRGLYDSMNRAMIQYF